MHYAYSFIYLACRGVTFPPRLLQGETYPHLLPLLFNTIYSALFYLFFLFILLPTINRGGMMYVYVAQYVFYDVYMYVMLYINRYNRLLYYTIVQLLFKLYLDTNINTL